MGNMFTFMNITGTPLHRDSKSKIKKTLTSDVSKMGSKKIEFQGVKKAPIVSCNHDGIDIVSRHKFL